MLILLRTRFFVFLIFSTTVLQRALADDNKPEYKFVLDKLIKVVESSDILTSDLTVEKRDNDVVINGEVKQLVDMDNDWKVKMEIFRAEKSDGEYNKMMTIPEKGVCDLCKTHYKTLLYQSLKNYTNAPDPDKCPVTKETYIVKDYPVDSSKINKMLKPGYYRVIGCLLKDGVEQNKYIIEGHVEEQK